jgi:hypothetical protein
MLGLLLTVITYITTHMYSPQRCMRQQLEV